MTQTAINYAKVLIELKISKNSIDEAKRITESSPELREALLSLVVSVKKKHNIIEKVYPKEIQNFFKVLCDHKKNQVIDEIFAAYENLWNEQNRVLKAKLTYVTPPDDAQLEKIKQHLMEKHGKHEIEISLEKDPEIIGGFVIEVDNIITDWSTKNRIGQLQQRLVRR